MSERYMYKISYRLTSEQAQRLFGWLSDDPRINQQQTILLDAIEDTNVNLDSTISTHPQLDGTEVADHMYRNPLTMSISGAFSAFGGNLIDTNNNTGGGMMQWIQNLFEFIKDNGIICKLSKIAQDSGKTAPRFKLRNNMVLQSIAWTEKLMSMSYTFTFIEVQLAKIQEYHVDETDSFLPSIDILQSISFTQEIINWNNILNLVLAIGVETEFIDPKIIEEAMGTVGIYSIGALAFTGVGIYLLGGVSAIPVAGWIILGVAALAIIGVGIAQAVRQAMLSKKFKEEQIRYFGNDVEDRKQVERLNNFLSNISKQLVKLDESVTAYSMTITDPCQFYVNFENNYYLCEVQNYAPKGMSVAGDTYNRRGKPFHAFVFKDLDGNPLGKWVQIETAYDDLFECSVANCIYRLPYTGSYVYLLRKYNYVDISGHSFSGSGRSFGEDTSSSSYYSGVFQLGEATDTYYLVATKIAPEQFGAVIREIVLEAIMR